MHYFSLYSNKIILKKNNNNCISFYSYIKKLVSLLGNFVDNFFIDFLLDFFYKNIEEIYTSFFLSILNCVEAPSGHRFEVLINNLHSFFVFFFKHNQSSSLLIKNKSNFLINFSIKDRSFSYKSMGKFIITNRNYYKKSRYTDLFIYRFSTYCKNIKTIKTTNANLNNYYNLYLIFKTLNSNNYLVDEKTENSFLINLYFKKYFFIYKLTFVF